MNKKPYYIVLIDDTIYGEMKKKTDAMKFAGALIARGITNVEIALVCPDLTLPFKVLQEVLNEEI